MPWYHAKSLGARQNALVSRILQPSKVRQQWIHLCLRALRGSICETLSIASWGSSHCSSLKLTSPSCRSIQWLRACSCTVSLKKANKILAHQKHSSNCYAMDAHSGHKCSGSTSAQSAKAEDARTKAAMLECWDAMAYLLLLCLSNMLDCLDHVCSLQHYT